MLVFEKIKDWESEIEGMDFEGFCLPKENSTDESDVAPVYAEFKKNYRIPEDARDYIYDIENVGVLSKFYKPEDIEFMKNRWEIEAPRFSWLELPDDFSGKRYVSMYRDLDEAFNQAGMLFVDPESWGRFHYIRFGRKEGRQYRAS